MADHILSIAALTTPCLLLDEAKMTRNIDWLADHACGLNVTLRPHLKTVKSIDVARRVLTGGTGPATVSTIAEAEVFAGAGINDIVYAVGIAPQKLDRVLVLHRNGCDLTVLLDSVTQAEAVATACRDSGISIPALIEIDCDGHRGGLKPNDPKLIKIGRVLHDSSAILRGVLTHAGESYGAQGIEALSVFAEMERAAAVAAAEGLRAAGLPCPVVSIGSTPTAHAGQDMTGITELRAGVYVFFDLVMAGIGVCKPENIALSVLTTIIGHQPDRGWLLIDAGWMAMSQDKGTAGQAIDQGYGMVCDANGTILPDLIVLQANQEHGIIACRPGSNASLPDIATGTQLTIGTQLQILPNHACATAAQHQSYHVLPAKQGEPIMVWSRFNGW